MGPGEFGAQQAASISSEHPVVLIEKRDLIRSALVYAVRLTTDFGIYAYSDVEAWQSDRNRDPPCLIVLSIGGFTDDEAEEHIDLLLDLAGECPTAVLADNVSRGAIVAALSRGVRGYIPTSMQLRICIEAMRLVSAGGTYAPISDLLESSAVPSNKTAPTDAIACDDWLRPPWNQIFTPRQQAVVSAICRGKSNKAIAYELGINESTVKVHVRSVMRKLNATNRTEVAFIINNNQQAN